jgi:hypothetical protein
MTKYHTRTTYSEAGKGWFSVRLPMYKIIKLIALIHDKTGGDK